LRQAEINSQREIDEMKIKGKNGPQGRRNREAFTLVEVLIAVLIMAIVFSTVFMTMSMGLTISQASRENLRATQIMTDKMEGIRLYNWTQLNNSGFLVSTFTIQFYETNNIGLANATGSGPTYTGAVVVANCSFSTSYSTNMRQVTVTIGWTSGRNGTTYHTRSMMTYVSMMGLQNYVYND
jgi:prepilin-type N-terminal cleavage/methylation domain-containing protein